MNGSSKFSGLFNLAAAPSRQSTRAFVFTAVIALAGCGEPTSRIFPPRAQPDANACCAIEKRQHSDRDDKLTPQQLKDVHRASYDALLEAHRGDAERTLRVRLDTSRHRLWVLTPDDLYVYDIENQRLIRRIALPGWSVTEFLCPPDLALDSSGTVFISDNVQSRLWRIDADSFRLTEHVIRLLHKEHWDMGFSGLTFATDGTLLAVAASGGSLWSIDLANGRAREVERAASSLDACPLATVRKPEAR